MGIFNDRCYLNSTFTPPTGDQASVGGMQAGGPYGIGGWIVRVLSNGNYEVQLDTGPVVSVPASQVTQI